jgi:hypothetical protein
VRWWRERVLEGRRGGVLRKGIDGSRDMCGRRDGTWEGGEGEDIHGGGFGGDGRRGLLIRGLETGMRAGVHGGKGQLCTHNFVV